MCQTSGDMTPPCDLNNILVFSRKLGVSDAVVIRPDRIPVDEKFAGFCKKPGCPGYNRSMSCPPHAGNPGKFRSLVKTFDRALVFRFDVPSGSLLGAERLDLMGLIHETAAAIERFARQAGCSRARGFAGGSCKEVFCKEFLHCRVLHEKKSCRNPMKARQSMSAMGVNFLALTRTVDWHFKPVTPRTAPEKTAMVAGLVLLD